MKLESTKVTRDYEILVKKAKDKRIIDSDDVTDDDTESDDESSDYESTEEERFTESRQKTTDDRFVKDPQKKRKRTEKDVKYDLKRKKNNPSNVSNTKTEIRASRPDYEILDEKAKEKKIIDSDDVTDDDTESDDESSDYESTEEERITEARQKTTDDGLIKDQQNNESEDETSENTSTEENQTTQSEDNTSDETSDNKDMGSESIDSVEEFRSQKKMKKTDHGQYKDKKTKSEDEEKDFKPAKKTCALDTSWQTNAENYHKRYSHKQNKKTFSDDWTREFQNKKINSKNIFAINNTTIVDRKRQRYKHIPKPPKCRADIPVSRWGVPLLSKILVFKDTVVEMNDFDSQPNNLVKEIFDEIKPRLLLLTEATESGNSFFTKEISETEAGTTMILNEIFLLLCSKLKISMKRSESLDCSYMPNARFDYRFYNSEGKVIGIAEAKSINTLKPESVVQAIMQLLVTQCEVSNLFPDKTGTPLFNILTDGYRYVFIVLSKKKLAFERYKDKLNVRTITKFSDLKIILNRLTSVVKSSL